MSLAGTSRIKFENAPYPAVHFREWEDRVTNLDFYKAGEIRRAFAMLIEAAPADFEVLITEHQESPDPGWHRRIHRSYFRFAAVRRASR